MKGEEYFRLYLSFYDTFYSLLITTMAKFEQINDLALANLSGAFSNLSKQDLFVALNKLVPEMKHRVHGDHLLMKGKNKKADYSHNTSTNNLDGAVQEAEDLPTNDLFTIVKNLIAEMEYRAEEGNIPN
jgi:hypothetical protein